METCTGPECTRPIDCRKLCKAHYKQWKTREKDLSQLTPIGDPTRKAQLARERWASKTAAEKASHLAKFTNSGKRPRDEQWRQRQSESLRARWATTGIELPTQRSCRSCEQPFKPNSGAHWHCTKECRNTAKRALRYGITMKQYMTLVAAQNSRCALCGEAWRGFGISETLHIDHCHTTGRVRGLLCGNCNTALGCFGDDPARLRAAIAYLEADR